jgi:hypothetical protein
LIASILYNGRLLVLLLLPMRMLTRSAVKRLAVLFAVLAVVIICCGAIMIRMPLKSFRGELPPLTQEQTALRDELRAHVQKLAGDIGERNVFQIRKLNAAVDFIEAVFTNAGFVVKRQTYKIDTDDVHNLEVEIQGSTLSNEIVVVGAHYDSVSGSPGADDNASGTAAVLSLAKHFALQKPTRTLRFVAFVNEEPPFFWTEKQGSLVYARRCAERKEHITAMMSIESIGFYKTDKGSQKYPFPVGLFYPKTADFIAFVSRTKDRQLVRRCIKTFREHARFPSEGGALPGTLPGIGWSDHWAFWEAGYPAIMVTDTTLFRSPHYHEETETPDVVDFDRMTRVVDGLKEVISDLANR